jgi:DNA replication protein DnaC
MTTQKEVATADGGRRIVEVPVDPIATTRQAGETLEAALERMNRMAAAMGQLRKDLTAKAASEPKVLKCEFHGVELPMDMDASVKHSYAAQEFKFAYQRCGMCLQEERVRRASQWLRSKGVPANMLHASLTTFQPKNIEDQNNVQAVREFIKKRVGFLILYGEQKGNGKTHLAVSVMREIQLGRFITHNQLLNLLRQSYGSRKASGDDVIRQHQQSRLLILDELGLSTGGRDDLPMLHEILTYRYSEKLPTVITANVSLMEFQEIIGERMVDRLRESTFKALRFTGPSKRTEKRREYFEDALSDAGKEEGREN